MRHPVNFKSDLPSKNKTKEIIFYPKYLKIYGVLPYLLNRKVNGQFCSTVSRCAEPNFTLVAYNQPSPEVVKELFEWLAEGAGFEWSIACKGEKIAFNPYKKPETDKPHNVTLEQVVEANFKVSDLGHALREPRHDDAVLGGQNPSPVTGALVLGDRDSIKLAKTPEELETVCRRPNMVKKLAEFYEFVDRNAVEPLKPGKKITGSLRLLTLWGDGATRINACYYHRLTRSIDYDPLDRLHIRLGNSNRIAIYSDGKLEIITNNQYIVADAEYQGLAQLKLIHENISKILSLEITRKFLLLLLQGNWKNEH